MQRVEEGKSYSFNIIKMISVDENEFFVLEGPDKRRYLLSVSGYKSYNLGGREVVSCRVDKINCKGEVFLEPEHPGYREGEYYSFRFICYDKRVTREGDEIDVALFEADTDEPLVVPIGDLPDMSLSADQVYSMKIAKITKGVISVESRRVDRGARESEEEKLYDFRVLDISLGIDGREYFIVENISGERYTIPYKYYAHYGLEKGSLFRGRYLRYRDARKVTVEPENPWFVKGSDYSFTIKEFVKLDDGMKESMVIVDEFGFAHSVDRVRDHKLGDTIRYRVERMRKGWPLLKRM